MFTCLRVAPGVDAGCVGCAGRRNTTRVFNLWCGMLRESMHHGGCLVEGGAPGVEPRTGKDTLRVCTPSAWDAPGVDTSRDLRLAGGMLRESNPAGKGALNCGSRDAPGVEATHGGILRFMISSEPREALGGKGRHKFAPSYLATLEQGALAT